MPGVKGIKPSLSSVGRTRKEAKKNALCLGIEPSAGASSVDS
jgi:hypothetical protein